MDLPTFRALLTRAGQEALEAAASLEPREVDFLRHFQALSQRYPREVARGALEVAILRGQAKHKFPFAAKLYLTREALEQASAHPVASYRAGRFEDFSLVIDLGCSVGGDTIALVQVTPTLGIEIDPLRLSMAQENLRSLSLEADFLQADITDPLPCRLSSSHAMFFDPARRINSRRFFSVNDYQPPLSIVKGWLNRISALGVKISPGVKLDELSSYDAEVEFISLKGDLKEAALWFGSMKTAPRRATLLPGPHTMAVDEVSQRIQDAPPSLSEPLVYLYEPDAAVIRAGLVRPLGVQLNAFQLDPDIAYLTADTHTETPFARVWAVEDWFPFQLKRLRAYLRDRGVGHLVVKKRGSPLQPEAVIRRLRLKGDARRVVFLTHLRGRPIVVVCYPE
jgi:hypothetical protein